VFGSIHSNFSIFEFVVFKSEHKYLKLTGGVVEGEHGERRSPNIFFFWGGRRSLQIFGGWRSPDDIRTRGNGDTARNSRSWFSENHWNCCHKMWYFKAKMHQIGFRLGLRPRLRWGNLQRSPVPLAGFTGSAFTGSEGGRTGGKAREGRGEDRGREERGGEEMMMMMMCNDLMCS